MEATTSPSSAIAKAVCAAVAAARRCCRSRQRRSALLRRRLSRTAGRRRRAGCQHPARAALARAAGDHQGQHRSTVHRPGYLDYIGVKRFDAEGRAIGEARILGLWTSQRLSRRSAPDSVAAPQAQRGDRALSVRANQPRRQAPDRRSSRRLPRDELFQASVGGPGALRARRAGTAGCARACA